jgi:hypothetical protein
VSLRHRAVRTVPAFALLVAAGVLERRRVLRLALRRDTVRLDTAGRAPRGFEAVVEALGVACGWVCVRGPDGARWAELATAAAGLGLLTLVGDRVTLDEAFFHRLQLDPEHRELWEDLQPLVASFSDAALPPSVG